MSERDRKGGPFNAARLGDREVDELIGLCRGVLSDGVVTDGEARFLARWLDANRGAANRWPGNVLYERIRTMLADDVLDPEEQGELLDLLSDITGDLLVSDRAASYSSTLPLCSPAPDVEFSGRAFCLTGKFVYGTRRTCETAIHESTGLTVSVPSRKTDYLVIGAIGTPAWIHSTYGRKIEKAVALRDEGVPIRIVSEEHWTAFLPTD